MTKQHLKTMRYLMEVNSQVLTLTQFSHKISKAAPNSFLTGNNSQTVTS